MAPLTHEGRRNIRYGGKCAGCGCEHAFCDRVTGVWCSRCWPKLRLVPCVDESGKVVPNHFQWDAPARDKLTQEAK